MLKSFKLSTIFKNLLFVSFSAQVFAIEANRVSSSVRLALF